MFLLQLSAQQPQLPAPHFLEDLALKLGQALCLPLASTESRNPSRMSRVFSMFFDVFLYRRHIGAARPKVEAPPVPPAVGPLAAEAPVQALLVLRPPVRRVS